MKPKWVAVFDFDGTCLPQKLGSVYNVADSNGALDEKNKLLAQKTRSHFMKKIEKNSLTSADSRKWLLDCSKFYINSGLSLKKLEKILWGIELQDGLVDCFHYLKEHNIPITIVSFGLSQFIEVALKANNAHYFVSNIYAANLIVDANGLIVGLDPATMVLPGKEKGRFSRLFAKQHNVSCRNILAVGDSFIDAYLGFLRKNRLGITNSEEKKKILEKYMGEIVVTESFNPVLEWFKRKIEG